MTDQTQFAPATPFFSNLINDFSKFITKLLSRKTKQIKKTYKPAKRFSAGLSPDTVAYDWGHHDISNHDRFR